jgi:hypothetical protein
MDNILFSTKKEIINNFPIESTHPPRSTHGGSFELPKTLSVDITYSRIQLIKYGVLPTLIPKERNVYHVRTIEHN